MKKICSSIFLLYLRICAKIQLLKFKPLIIGVAGSSGKSSVSLLIGEILSEKYRVKETMGKNSETGIPLSLLGISPRKYNIQSWMEVTIVALIKVFTNFKKYDIFVAEMGIDSPHPPKNMGYLLKIIKPRIAVLTNISYEHSIYFEQLVNEENEEQRLKKTLDLIVNEEISLLKSLKDSDTAIVNIDDENIKKHLDDIKAKIIKVSREDSDANLFIKKVSVSLTNSSYTFTVENKEYDLEADRALPEFFSYSFGLSIATAVSSGMSVNESISAIKNKFTLPPGRSSIFNGIKNTKIIDSSYNSSLEPTVGMLKFLNNVAGDKRKVAILGDMREQGNQSKMLHESLAWEIVKNVDLAILIGPMMSEFVSPILEKNNKRFETFQSFSEAKEPILKEISEGDIILVKGSQNNLLLERVVEMLLKDKGDSAFLCRREKFWEKIRSATP